MHPFDRIIEEILSQIKDNDCTLQDKQDILNGLESSFEEFSELYIQAGGKQSDIDSGNFSYKLLKDYLEAI